jgi:signal transduction histidine kinase/DNA-binding NarL/FixJ family response regulator
MWRLEILGLANGGVFLAALAAFVLSFPLAPSTFRLAAVGVFAGCAGIALWLRRRFWAALEDELRRRRQAEQEARAADRAKGQFLADVSHEIRTPMHGVLGMSDLLLQSELAPVQREQVEAVRTSAEALLALINDILDLSRIEAGRLPLRLSDFQLRKLAGDVVRLLGPQAAAREVDLTLHIAPELPDDLHGDPVRLRQVLLNLIGNAIRFTRQGSVTVSFDLRRGEGEVPAVRCQVRDTGAGIRPALQAQLFQPFIQSESAVSLQLGGTGLGLVISKNIVELMGGTIDFESTYGVGTTFWFQVPLVQARGAGALPQQALPEATGEADRHATRFLVRILVVDDHPVNRSVALSQLRRLGYLVDVAASGAAALGLLAERSYGMVLLDCAMPELDGYETCRRLRQMEGQGEGQPRRVPVIALTAHAMEGEREKCLAAGMDDFLAKPYRVDELTAVLDRWTGGRTPPAPGTGIGAAGPAPPTPPAPPPALPPLITERIAQLQRLGATTGEDVLAQVLKSFLGRGAEDLAAMAEALAREDGTALAAAAHSLGGSSGLLGALELARRCAELERFARNGDLAACASPLQAVLEGFREVAGQLAPGHGPSTTSVE